MSELVQLPLLSSQMASLLFLQPGFKLVHLTNEEGGKKGADMSFWWRGQLMGVCTLPAPPTHLLDVRLPESLVAEHLFLKLDLQS